jgi:hypothetical protein
MADTSYQMYPTYMPSSPDGSFVSNFQNRQSATSFSSQQYRPPSPTSITGLLTSPEPIQAGWTPTSHQGHYSFPQPQDGGKRLPRVL